jgi:hypothetical protein
LGTAMWVMSPVGVSVWLVLVTVGVTAGLTWLG